MGLAKPELFKERKRHAGIVLDYLRLGQVSNAELFLLAIADAGERRQINALVCPQLVKAPDAGQNHNRTSALIRMLGIKGHIVREENGALKCGKCGLTAHAFKWGSRFYCAGRLVEMKGECDGTVLNGWKLAL